MPISNIQSTTSTAATAQPEATTLGKDAFMKLLVTQLKNQDPTSPADSSQYVAQLAQFSSLEQMQALNDNIIGLAVLQQNNALMSQLTQSSALIGQQVRFTDPNTNEEKVGIVGSVRIENDIAQLSIGGTSVPLGNVTEVLGQPAEPESQNGNS